MNDYPTFNKCEHTFLDFSHLDPHSDEWMHTISIKLPLCFVTLCVMQTSVESACVDVKYHTTGDGKTWAMGFKEGKSQSIKDYALYTVAWELEEAHKEGGGE